MMKTLVLGLMTFLALSGGATAVAAAEPAAPAAPSARRVLAAGGAALWGINYSQVRVEAYGKDPRTGYYRTDVTQGLPVFSGKGELIRLTYDSYAFRVPADQVLVINQLEGQGVFFINGYSAQAYGAPLAVQYLFGPGELVGIRFAPIRGRMVENYDRKNATKQTTYYSTLHISGYLADPSLFNGAGAKLAK